MQTQIKFRVQFYLCFCIYDQLAINIENVNKYSDLPVWSLHVPLVSVWVLSGKQL